MKGMLIVILLLSATLVACSQGERSGTLAVQLTDAPAGPALEKAMVTISNVQVHAAENESEETGWMTITQGPMTFDLVALKDVKELLGSAQLAEGKYTQMRLDIDQASATISGEDHMLDVPSQTVKLTHGFMIEAGKTTTLTLDFDPQKSVVETGNGKYLLKPTITIMQE